MKNDQGPLYCFPFKLDLKVLLFMFKYFVYKWWIMNDLRDLPRMFKNLIEHANVVL